MMYDYQSKFGCRIKAFIAQKNALGYPYRESCRILRDFDSFCMSKFPLEFKLTQELCTAWAMKKPTEGNNTFRNRLMPIREFAYFLIQNGEAAYVIPSNLAKHLHAQVPYIFSTAEILSLWNYFDNIPERKNYPVRHLVIPMLFRLLYCCGLRPAEVRKLCVNDVVLERGRLNIAESKGHRSRVVMMADDVSEMMRNYNQAVSATMPHRTVFFPDSNGNVYTKEWIEKTFRIARKAVGLSSGTGGNFPRPYDFRHSFATHRLYRWMKEGKDLKAMLPYLSAYMGHTELSHTYYYIHLVPGMFEEMSGFDFSKTEALLPEVSWDD